MTDRDLALVGDIGATNTRLALIGRDGRVGSREQFASPDADLVGVLQAYRARHPQAATRCVLGVAGRVQRGSGVARVRLTNRALELDAGALGRALALPVELFNDVEALAAALPVLGAEELDLMGGPPPVATEPRLVIAVGTGLGAALLTPRGEVVATEAGHIAMPQEISQRLDGDGEGFDRIEALLSGDGLRRLERARARSGSIDAAAEARAMFAGVLGDLCQTLVLATGAWGGVHLAGGVIEGLGAELDPVALRRSLCAEGAFAAALAALPLARILDRDAALRGLARLARGDG